MLEWGEHINNNDEINEVSQVPESFKNPNIPESLKKPGWWPIFIMDWGWPGWGASMAAEIYAYLEAGNEIPKVIIGSSIWSMIALYLQYNVDTKIAPLEDWVSEEELKKYQKQMREVMMNSLDNLFNGDFTSKFEIIWIVKSLLDLVWNDQKQESTSSKFFTQGGIWAAEDIFSQNSNTSHFDIWAAISLDRDGDIDYNNENDSYILYNNKIDSSIIDASTAHEWTLGKTIDDVTYHDGNYGDFINTLSNHIWVWQKIVFFTSYSWERPYNMQSLNGKVAHLSKINTNASNVVWNKKDRFNMHNVSEIYNAHLIAARKKYQK